MASRSRGTLTTDLGTVDGWFGEDGITTQLSEARVDVGVSGPTGIDGAPFVALELTVLLPGTNDKRVSLELPVHTAERLRDALDAALEETEGR